MLRLARSIACAMVATIGIYAALAPAAQAQTTEERFQDLFVTAGYCTAFGAAFGAAVLFVNPNIDASTHLQYVAVGASLGFISGSVLGSYIIFSPMFSERQDGASPAAGLAADGLLPAGKVVVRPTIDVNSHALTSIEGGMALARW